MPAVDDDALCIRHWDYSETSQTVGLLTLSHGLLRAIAKGSRRERSAFSGGIDLLTAGRATLFLKPTQGLATLTAWQLQEHFPGVRSCILPNRIAFYAADLVCRMAGAHDPNPAMFRGLRHLLQGLGTPDGGVPCSEEGAHLLLLEFQWLMLHASGLQPILGDAPADVEAVLFAPHDGGRIVQHSGGPVWKVRPSTIQLLRSLQLHGALPTGTVDAACVQRANRLLAAYIRESIGEQMPTLVSLFGEVT